MEGREKTRKCTFEGKENGWGNDISEMTIQGKGTNRRGHNEDPLERKRKDKGNAILRDGNEWGIAERQSKGKKGMENDRG